MESTRGRIDRRHRAHRGTLRAGKLVHAARHAVASTAEMENGNCHVCRCFPTAAMLNLTLGRAIQSWPFILGSAIFNACMVSLLTWAVMPLVTRALHDWLHSNERRTSP